jgi:NhaP-type Na+/H+ and K+/H+ antiporter
MFPNDKDNNNMIFNREPALVLAAISAIVLLAAGFGLDVSTEQLALINAAAAAIVGVIVRSKVTPV